MNNLHFWWAEINRSSLYTCIAIDLFDISNAFQWEKETNGKEWWLKEKGEKLSKQCKTWTALICFNICNKTEQNIDSKYKLLQNYRNFHFILLHSLLVFLNFFSLRKHRVIFCMNFHWVVCWNRLSCQGKWRTHAHTQRERKRLHSLHK